MIFVLLIVVFIVLAPLILSSSAHQAEEEDAKLLPPQAEHSVSYNQPSGAGWLLVIVLAGGLFIVLMVIH